MFTENDIDDYLSRLTEDQKAAVLERANETGVEPVICAWYDNHEDFYSDWCEDPVNYSKDYADELLSDKREFLIFDNGEIVRFVR